MESGQEKYFSVVIRLNEFDGLNGELAKISDAQKRKNFIRDFFLQRYGEGCGRLEIIQRKTKVKLKWLPPKVDSRAEDLHKLALVQARNRNFVEAINSWVKAISVNSNDPDYYFNLGIAFFEIKNYKESIENLNKALRLCPIYYKAHIILGTVYLKVRHFDSSEKHLKESIRFYPNHALAYLNLGAVYSILKRYDDAIATFSKALELCPDEVRAHFGIGKIYSLKNDVEKANYYFKKVIELDKKGNLATHAKRALITAPLENDAEISKSIDQGNFENLYREGYRSFLFADYEKATMMYNGYLKHRPKDDFVWFSLGEAYLRSGEAAKAAAAFHKAVNLNSKKALYYKELSIAYSYLGKDQDVIRCATKAKLLGKSDSITNSFWGKALLNLEKYDDAIPLFEEAVRLNSNNLFAKFYLAIALTKVNQTNHAINYLQEVIRSPIKSPLKMEAKTILESLGQ